MDKTQLTNLDHAYEIFLQTRAELSQQSVEAVRSIISQDAFSQLVISEHDRFQRQEFGFEELAQALGIGPFTLDEILITLGLPVYN
jgi:predicted GTPase